MNSGRFVLSATTTSVTVDADIIDPHGEIVNENYKGHVYAVELYSKGGFQVGRREFVIGGPRTAMFYGFSADKEYYLKISNPTYLPVGWTVKGSGTITNVKSVS